MLCDDLVAWDGGRVGWGEGGREGIYVYIQLIHCCITETNTTL